MPKLLRANPVALRNPVLVSTAHQTVTVVEKVNAVINLIDVLHLAVQNVTQIWTVVRICIAVSILMIWIRMSADVIASERDAIVIQTVPCMNIVFPVKHVGHPDFLVATPENVRAVENAVNLADVLLLTVQRAIRVVTVASFNTAAWVRVTVQTAVVRAVIR